MDEEIAFLAAADRVYRQTRERFESWAHDPAYRPYVVPASTAPKAGFAVFYTPLVFRPLLAIIGQNPSNFAGVGADLTDPPNAEMLRGFAPRDSSYDSHDHLFGSTLRSSFSAHPSLYAGSAGMNVWHFQCVREAASAPRPLRQFCEENSRSLIAAMQPFAVLCFGEAGFKALVGSEAGEQIEGALKARVVRRRSTSIWFVPHLTGSWTAADAQHDLPIVLDKIAREAERS